LLSNMVKTVELSKVKNNRELTLVCTGHKCTVSACFGIKQ
jgi:hypothetical protein